MSGWKNITLKLFKNCFPQRELGEDRLVLFMYIKRMENTYGNKKPFTESIPSSSRTRKFSIRNTVDAPLNQV